MEQTAQLIGANAPAVLLALMTAILGAIALLWRWLERSDSGLWRAAGALWSLVGGSPPLKWLRARFPQLWAFVGRRLSPEGYLGLHLTLGLATVLAALWLFAEIAEEIVSDEELVRFDLALSGALHEHASPLALALFGAVTLLGDTPVLTAVGLAGGAALLAQRRWLRAAGLLVAIGGGGLLNLALKTFFQRARPAFPNPFVVETGWSFPSGHAMGALVTYGMLAYVLLLALDRRWRRPVVIAAVALVLLIGASRMYLGVHYLSDVVAGFVAGAAWLAICVTGVEVARRHARPAPTGREGRQSDQGD